jgi:hypothetical protein
MEKPRIGQKIVLKVPYWYDGGEVAKGSTGVVERVETERGQSELSIAVQMDEHNRDLEDNIICFYPHCGPQEDSNGREYKDTLDWFYSECELVD